MLNRVDAIATTVSIEPGTERMDDQGTHIRNRTFTDRVQSSDTAFDGTNRVTLDLDIDSRGGGVLHGVFELELTSGNGAWKGELEGRFENGMVVAEGMGRGAGAQDGAVVHIDYRQITAHPGKPPIEQSLAFFDMKAVVLGLVRARPQLDASDAVNSVACGAAVAQIADRRAADRGRGRPSARTSHSRE